MAIRRRIYQVAPRMLIKARAGGPYKPPTEGAKRPYVTDGQATDGLIKVV